jgi:hypothetical protein
MRRLFAEVVEQRVELLKEWERIHGRRDWRTIDGGRGARP